MNTAKTSTRHWIKVPECLRVFIVLTSTGTVKTNMHSSKGAGTDKAGELHKLGFPHSTTTTGSGKK